MQAYLQLSVKHGFIAANHNELAVSFYCTWTLYTDLYARAPLDVLGALRW